MEILRKIMEAVLTAKWGPTPHKFFFLFYSTTFILTFSKHQHIHHISRLYELKFVHKIVYIFALLYYKMHSIGSSSKIHDYLSQSMFTTS